MNILIFYLLNHYHYLHLHVGGSSMRTPLILWLVHIRIFLIEHSPTCAIDLPCVLTCEDINLYTSVVPRVQKVCIDGKF